MPTAVNPYALQMLIFKPFGLQPLAHCQKAVNTKGQVIFHYVSNSMI